MEAQLDTFIVVHDQDVLLRCESQGRYRHLPEPRFIVVGAGPTDLIDDRDDVVLAQELPDHIEDRSELLAFTAWYAVSRNRLGRAPYVAMLEYDVDIGPDFVDATLDALTTRRDALVGYVPLPLSDAYFAGTDAPFVSALAETYGIDVERLVVGQLTSTGSDLWTTTSNLSLSRAALDAFVDWYLPVADAAAGDRLVGHVHERCIPVFGMLTGREMVSVPRVLWHRAVRSHGVDVAVVDEHAVGTRRLPRSPDDPALSVVIVARDDAEPLWPLLASLSPEHQVGLDADHYEVVVVDDGSQPPLDGDRIRATGQHVRYVYRGSSVRDTIRALDVGAELARGEQLGLIRHATGIASPGVLRWASEAIGHFDASLVAVPTDPRAGGAGETAIFCSRRYFVGSAGAAGVIEALYDDRDVDTAVVTLTGESIGPGHLSEPRPEASDRVYFGPGSLSASHELDYAWHVVADRDAQLRDLRASTSWRITWPLRQVTGLIRVLAGRR